MRETRCYQVGANDLVRQERVKSSASSNSKELDRMTNQAKEEVGKRRNTEAAMGKLEEVSQTANESSRPNGRING